MEFFSGNYPTDLLAALRSARCITVLTGAGISAESGVPTFREAQSGLWSRFRPEELATPEAFQQNPRRVWEWYAWRREMVAKAIPNPAHLSLVKIEQSVSCFNLITQNVDGLHQLAGSQAVIELHGNLKRTKCSSEGVMIENWNDTGELPPRCPTCGSFLRPDVVWFGEMLPEKALETSLKLTKTCDIFFSIGTSSLVQPAATLPYIALEHHALVIEINPVETPLTSLVPYSLHGQAGEILPDLVNLVWGQ